MQFTTPVPVTEGSPKIDYNSHIVSLGSCFAVNIGQKFDYFKLNNTTNPFGILFHPLALEKFIHFAANQKTFTEADIFFNNERWHCFDAHSDLSSNTAEALITNLNTAVTSAYKNLKNATHVIITLGTAWAYREIASGKLVANCHKVPQKQFSKELLSIQDIHYRLDSIIEIIKELNPAAHVLFTVSPVRHTKDGLVQNQWSKSNLISALHTVLATPPLGAGGLYFPSYEIMMDELRDYRFYSQDMIHPSQIAIDYIWHRFTEAWIEPEALKTMNTVDSIQKGLQHRPFNLQSTQHIEFTEKLKEQAALLQQRYPHITF